MPFETQKFAEISRRIKVHNTDHVALISAIARSEFDLASKILARDSENKYIHPVGPLKVTALHMAAWQGRIDLLDQLYAKGADVNAADKIGRCALYYAAHRGYIDVTRWILEHKGDIHAKVGINSCTKDIHNATMIKSNFVGKTLPLPTCWDRTPLHQAVKNNHTDVVRLLADAGADMNAKDEHSVTPLLLAGSSVDRDNDQEMAKFVEIIRILMIKKAFVNIIHPDTGTTALHHAAILGSAEATELLLENGAWPMFKCKSSGSTPLHIAASGGSTETLIALLKVIQPHRINSCDQVSCTALHRASYQGHSECVRILIKHGGNLAATTKTGVTVIDAIFAHIPRPSAFLTDILDSCIRTTNNCSLEKYDTITVDFGILAPKYHMQMKVIKALITATSSNIVQLAILQHPVVETFLRLKWAKLKIFFFLLVLVYILFIASLSSYALVLIEEENKCQPFRYFVLRWLLAVYAVILLIHNMIQVLLEPRYYLKQYETWLTNACVILSLAISIADGFTNCKNETEKGKNQTQDTQVPMEEMETPMTPTQQGMSMEGTHNSDSQYLLHCMSITILLAWIKMMLLIGRFPMWGYYALMFSTVLKNILKMLLAFGYLIIGFALSFAILFHENEKFCKKNQFEKLWNAIEKTVVMMMGEYEYDELSKKGLSYISRIVFFIFMILVSIVLINLMIGLAVNDIQAIEKEGHIRRLLKQAEFITHLERVTSHRIFRRSWLRPRLRIHSSRDIPTKITLSYRENYAHRTDHIEAPRDIPFELKESLFFLAGKTCCKNDQYTSTENRNAEDTDARLNSLLSNLEEHLQRWRSRGYTNSAPRKLLKRRGIKKKFI